VRSTPRRFVGANIKGTPKMRRRKVAEDLRVLRRRADLVVLQEFKWRTYWLALAANLRPTRWASFPSHARGLAAPVRGGQGVTWRRSVWRRVGAHVEVLHKGRARISESRWLRAVLVEDRASRLRCWHGGTHNVVGGDERSDSPTRRAMLDDNLDRLAEFLDDLASTGDPIVWEMDANVHRGTDAHERLVEIVTSRRGEFVGEHGVEYLFVIPGRHAVVEVLAAWRIRPRVDLNTDHEARGITYRLVAA